MGGKSVKKLEDTRKHDSWQCHQWVIHKQFSAVCVKSSVFAENICLWLWLFIGCYIQQSLYIKARVDNRDTCTPQKYLERGWGVNMGGRGWSAATSLKQSRKRRVWGRGQWLPSVGRTGTECRGSSHVAVTTTIHHPALQHASPPPLRVQPSPPLLPCSTRTVLRRLKTPVLQQLKPTETA